MAKPTTVNRIYKDRLFRFIFNNKKDLLSLYNAINNTNYSNPDDLTINTLEHVIYMGVKNDLSFLIYGILNLYEHQSTWNPNMPLRDLIYITDLLKGYVAEHQYDLYGSQRILIPVPQAIVFYNGTKDEPDRFPMKLSESFEVQERKSSLEFETLVLNINYGKNKDLMYKCKKLMDYSIFISKIRKYKTSFVSLNQAIEQAMKECIQEDVLSDILRKHRGEVTGMLLEEYDEQWHIDNEKRWSREEGLEEGKILGAEQVNQLNRLLAEQGRTEDIIRSASDKEYQEQLFQEFGL